MADDQTLPSAESLGDTPEAVSTVDAGIPGTPAIEVVPGSEVETDEQKNQRVMADAAKQAEQRRARNQQSINQRFKEITDEKNAANENVKTLIAQLASQRQPQQTSDSVPGRDQFDSYEDFLDAKAAHTAKAESARLFEQYGKQQQERQQAENQHREARDSMQQYQQRAAVLAKELPDFAEVMEGADAVQVPQYIGEALKRMEDGPRIAYHLIKNPSLVVSLQGDNPMQQLIALGEISASLKTTPKVSTASPPGKPAGVSRASSQGDPPEDTEAYFAWAAKHS